MFEQKNFRDYILLINGLEYPVRNDCAQKIDVEWKIDDEQHLIFFNLNCEFDEEFVSNAVAIINEEENKEAQLSTNRLLRFAQLLHCDSLAQYANQSFKPNPRIVVPPFNDSFTTEEFKEIVAKIESSKIPKEIQSSKYPVSMTFSSAFDKDCVFDIIRKDGHTFISRNEPNQNIIFTFRDFPRLIKKYTIYQANSGYNHPKSWKLSGRQSLDDDEWIDLDEVIDDNTFKDDGTSNYDTTKSLTREIKYPFSLIEVIQLRFEQTGPNHFNKHILMLGGITFETDPQLTM